MQISKDMLIGELLHVDENMAQILMEQECIALADRLHRWSLWKRPVWFTAFPWKNLLAQSTSILRRRTRKIR